MLQGLLSLRNDCQGSQILCRSCLSCLALFCSNKLSWCPQCVQTDGKTVKAVMAASRFPSIRAATTPARLVSLQTIAYIQALGIHSLSYTMPLKPLAARASVFNRSFAHDVALSVATGTDFNEDGFYIVLSKYWATSMATSWAWRVHLCFVRTSPAGGASSKEMSSTRLRRRRRRQPLLRQQPGRMVPALPMSLPRLRPVRVVKLSPAILRPARAPCCARRLLSQAAAADEK